MASIEIEDRTTPENVTDEALLLAARSERRQYHHSKSAELVACALIGNCEVVHEIFYDGYASTAYYYVSGIRVPREVYMDSIHTAERDRWEPECTCGECDVDVLPTPTPTKASA